jgi:nucleotide-binding universal stress UspA family protein
MNILVGYDGSHESKNALKLAQKHAKAMHAKIEVARAITRWDPLDYYAIQKAEQELEWGVQEILVNGKVPYETHLLLGMRSAEDQLTDFAEKYNIDEIIIGAPKRSRIGKLLLGSTAQYIILNAPCPVATVN